MILLELILSIIIKLGLFFIVIYINILAGSLLILFLKRTALNYFESKDNRLNIFKEIIKRVLNLENYKNIFKIIPAISLGYSIILPVSTILLYGYPFGYSYSFYKNDYIPSNYIKTFSFLVSLIFETLLIIVIKKYPTSIFWTASIIIDLLIINTIFIIINTLPIFPSLISFFIIEKLNLNWAIIYKNSSLIILLFMFLINGYVFIINKVVYFAYNALINIDYIKIYIFLAFLISILITSIIIIRNRFREILHHKISKTISLYKEIIDKIKNIENKEI